MTSGTTVRLRGVPFGDATHVWAVGDAGNGQHAQHRLEPPLHQSGVRPPHPVRALDLPGRLAETTRIEVALDAIFR